MRYQVGGSLTNNAPSYIYRQADTELYAALKRGEFCYVLNSRQMGKSSLLVRTRTRLQEAGYRCAVVDMTNIGSENITSLQWYKGIVKDLWRGFKLLKQVDLQSWWRDEEDISLLQRLSRFISDVLLKEFPNENLVIFIDEIDSILSLPFSVDDFFALIRFCYNQRAIDEDYKRISFAIFGVATPSDLIQDRKRTPFNLGTAIALNGFTTAEAHPLVLGLKEHISNAPAVLQAILSWTNGQPFLTQKLCQSAIHCVLKSSQITTEGRLTIPPGNELFWVDNLVQTVILTEWESRDEPEHLKTIRNRILSNQATAGRLLGLYQQILEDQIPLPVDDSPEQIELLLSGLVVKQQGYLQVNNRIYAAVFDLTWVEQQLKSLRPYSQTLDAWVYSQRQDESRLLRGQALQDAQQWAQGKRLSDLDYQFLAASVESDRRQIQQALEADRAHAMEAQLQQERRAIKLQRQLLATVAVALLIAICFGMITFFQYRQARISEIRALASSAEGNFGAHHQLEALVQAVDANTKLNTLGNADPALAQQVQSVLRFVSDGITASNQIDVGTGVQEVAIRPDGQMVAAVAVDGKLRLLQPNGQLLKAWDAHPAMITSVDWSQDGQTIATASADRTVKLWRADGTLLKTLPLNHSVRRVRFSPDAQKLAIIAGGQNAYLFHTEGRLIQHLPKTEHLAFSPDGQFLIAIVTPPPPPPRRLNPLEGETGSKPELPQPPPSRRLNQLEGEQTEPRPDPPQTINTRVLRSDGSVIAELSTEKGPIFAIGISPKDQTFATASVDGAVSLWNIKGELIKSFIGHRSNVRAISFSPDGQELATASTDNTVRLWQTTGGLLRTLSGHHAVVRAVRFSPDGHWLVSSSEDGSIRFWKPHHPTWNVLAGHTDTIDRLVFNADGSQLLSASVDFRLNFWRRDKAGQIAPIPEKTVFTNQLSVTGLAISVDGAEIANVFRGGTVELFDREGQNKQTLQTQTGARDVAFSPDRQQLIVGGSDGTVQVWDRTSNGQFPEQPSRFFVRHQGSVNTVAFSPNGKLIASGAEDKTIKFWYPDGRLFQSLTGHQAAINALAFSPQGDWLASASSDNTVKLWRIDGSLAHTLTGHAASVLEVTFSPDGQFLASSSIDGTVKVWQTNGSLLRTLTGHEGAVQTVVFSPESREHSQKSNSLIASAGLDRRIILWNWKHITAMNNISFACDWLQDYLSTHPSITEEHQQICQ